MWHCQAPPRDPIGPPLLIQDPNTVELLKFNLDLSLATPKPEICEAISTLMDVPPVAFLFKFVDINSGNISYKWIVSVYMYI